MTKDAIDLTRLENEQAELDVPILEIGQILLITADAFGLDAIDLFNSIKDGNGESAVAEFGIAARLAADFLDTALETSTQIPHILRYLEIDREISNLAELE